MSKFLLIFALGAGSVFFVGQDEATDFFMESKSKTQQVIDRLWKDFDVDPDVTIKKQILRFIRDLIDDGEQQSRNIIEKIKGINIVEKAYAIDYSVDELKLFKDRKKKGWDNLKEDPPERTVKDFNTSKRILRKIYSKTSLKNKTFYCGCDFNGKKVDLNSCGYKGRMKKGKEQYQKRSWRVEWEHVFPVSKAIGAFPECRKSNGKNYSRKDCLKLSKEFEELEANMYNLMPSVGSLNAHRSNYSYALIPGEKREWGSCDFEIDNKKVEPKEDIRGDIARVYFYLNQKYPRVGVISRKNKNLFEAWDKEDPVDEEECKLNKLKAQYQGDKNNYVLNKCN